MLWRYMDLAKLVSLFSTSALYLCKLAHLEDHFEGQLPKAVEKRMEAEFNAKWAPVLAPNNPPTTGHHPIHWSSELIRSTTYVSCWCLQNEESAAMWRIYGGDTGVAVRTRYDTLAEALPSDVYMGQVLYFDPATDEMPGDDALIWAMSKRHFFKHENECRIVKCLKGLGNPIEGAGWDDKYPHDEQVTVDLPTAIQDVIVSPIAPTWFHDVVSAVVEKFAPGLRIERSAMIP